MSGKASAKFELPEIIENKDGWGPCFIPEKFVDMPYQPFSKTDRIGKVADWTGNTYQDRRATNKYNSFFGSGTQYAYIHEEDDSSFQLVDTSKTHKPMFQKGKFHRNNQQRLNQRQRQQKQAQQQMQVLSRAGKGRERERMQQVRKWQKQMRQKYENRQGNQNQIKNREASVTVLPTWKVIEEMDFPRLGKLSLPGIEEPVDVYRCGSMEFFDKSYQNVNSKNEKPLQRINRVYHTVPTTDDPIIRELATKKFIEGQVKGVDVSDVKVYAIDTIISTLMCSTRSVNSWDVVVQKVDGVIFLDKRNTDFDLISVNETAAEPPNDEGNSINSPRNLALEATYINHNFSQQVLKSDEDKVSFENKNPFCQDNSNNEREHASVGYRYRKFDLGGGIGLIVRCEHDAVMTGPSGEVQYINIKALNEWDPRHSGGIDWRQKLDTQRGAALANELKNNSCKVAKWTVQSILAGSQQLRFGYVSRVHVKDSAKHSILGTQQFKPKEFADQINLNMDNAWGVLRYIVNTCMGLKNGKYLFLKDPNKPVVRLYDIPDDSFESEAEGSSDEDEA